MIVRITQAQALAMGIVHCKHCGHPPNNHFDFTFKGKKRPCAHCPDCPGYEQELSWRGQKLTVLDPEE